MERKGTISYTDCKSTEGIVVGLLDTIMNTCKILCDMDIQAIKSNSVLEALKDLNSDVDVHRIIKMGISTTKQNTGESELWESVLSKINDYIGDYLTENEYDLSGLIYILKKHFAIARKINNQ